MKRFIAGTAVAAIPSGIASIVAPDMEVWRWAVVFMLTFVAGASYMTVIVSGGSK